MMMIMNVRCLISWFQHFGLSWVMNLGTWRSLCQSFEWSLHQFEVPYIYIEVLFWFKLHHPWFQELVNRPNPRKFSLPIFRQLSQCDLLFMIFKLHLQFQLKSKSIFLFQIPKMCDSIFLLFLNSEQVEEGKGKHKNNQNQKTKHQLILSKVAIFHRSFSFNECWNFELFF